jgi:aspartate racemase
MVGGVGPESTVDYYRLIIALYREQKPDGSYPPILINSIDMRKMLGLVEANALSELADFLAGEAEKLARAGADFGLLASNTPHIVFDEVRRRSSIPLLSIVEATCAEAKAQRLGKLGLFGARFTMQGHFFPDVFSREGITLVVPTPDEQHYIHEKYMGELVKGVLLPETRAALLAIAGRLKQEEGIQGVILGGTELPLILRNVSERGMLFLDTTQIHVRAAVEQMLS